MPASMIRVLEIIADFKYTLNLLPINRILLNQLVQVLYVLIGINYVFRTYENRYLFEGMDNYTINSLYMPFSPDVVFPG